MGVLVIIGTQWGDEGKGKITNFLASKADYIVRYQGGDNAGHTVWIDNNKYVLHLLPSGIIEKNKKCIIGNGVVINPESLLYEINALKEKGIDVKNRLFISYNSHIILPYHKYIDEYRESEKVKIGTTKKGIGPAYADKYDRVGIRIIDYLNDRIFAELLKKNLSEKSKIISKFEDLEEIEARILKMRKKIKNIISEFACDTIMILNNALKEKKKILFEGAQGNMLDVDFGTYPYVTSSNPSVGGVCTGSGIPASKIKNVLGITKAYTTRVGLGPFPTELKEKTGEYLQKKGNEFGATTGRARRCGWLDLIVVKYSVMINGINSIALTKLDVLNGLDKIKVAYAYKYKNKIFKNFIFDRELIEKVIPVYKEFKGWNLDFSRIKDYSDFPESVKDYIKFIEDNLEIPVSVISTGTDKHETIIRYPEYLKFL